MDFRENNFARVLMIGEVILLDPFIINIAILIIKTYRLDKCIGNHLIILAIPKIKKTRMSKKIIRSNSKGKITTTAEIFPQ